MQYLTYQSSFFDDDWTLPIDDFTTRIPVDDEAEFQSIKEFYEVLYARNEARRSGTLEWSDDPFVALILPFAAYLEPLGY
jgi:hypothetical protein